MDVEGSKENLEEFKKSIKDIKIFEISALSNTGLEDVMDYLGELVYDTQDEEVSLIF